MNKWSIISALGFALLLIWGASNFGTASPADTNKPSIKVRESCHPSYSGRCLAELITLEPEPNVLSVSKCDNNGYIYF